MEKKLLIRNKQSAAAIDKVIKATRSHSNTKAKAKVVEVEEEDDFEFEDDDEVGDSEDGLFDGYHSLDD